MYGHRPKQVLSKSNRIGIACHGYSCLKQPFGNQGMTVEAQSQRGDGIDHPAKDVMFLKEASMLLKEFARNATQQHRLRAPTEQADRAVARLNQ
jgi:hypothetical protein